MIGIRIVAASTTAEAAYAVLRTAVEAGHTHGIGYWAEVVDLTPTRLILKDKESNPRHGRKKFTLTVVEIVAAINSMLIDPQGTESRGWSKRLLDDDYVDGPLADAIVQVACHGKVLYA